MKYAEILAAIGIAIGAAALGNVQENIKTLKSMINYLRENED